MQRHAVGFIDADGNPVRGVPDMITAPELYEQIHGEMPSGTIWEAFKVTVPLVQNTRGTVWAHGDIPEAARALGAAFTASLIGGLIGALPASGLYLLGFLRLQYRSPWLPSLALSLGLVALLWGLGVALQLRWPNPLLF
jgi:hypothetical protein